jgi:hypothetical protein
MKSTQQPYRPTRRIFAGGDAVTGPASLSVIAAIHIAVESIDRFINNENLLAGREKQNMTEIPKESVDPVVATTSITP